MAGPARLPTLNQPPAMDTANVMPQAGGNEDAMRWLKYIFDPTDPKPAPVRPSGDR